MTVGIVGITRSDIGLMNFQFDLLVLFDYDPPHLGIYFWLLKEQGGEHHDRFTTAGGQPNSCVAGRI